MNTCDTCKYWQVNPDYEFTNVCACLCPKMKAASYGRPAIGITSEAALMGWNGEKWQDLAADELGMFVDDGVDLFTGPKFGCIHHEAK
jgi:hypothetical protein